jgi:hypothetical protein
MKILSGPAIIDFDDVTISHLSSNSGVFMGKNSQMFWSSNIQRRSGFGSLTGKCNRALCNIHLVQPDGRSMEGSPDIG